MPEVNKANRQVCDLQINELKTKKPFLKFDTANTTTAGLSSDSVYAMAKGSRRIAFTNPLMALFPLKHRFILSSSSLCSLMVQSTLLLLMLTARLLRVQLPERFL